VLALTAGAVSRISPAAAPHASATSLCHSDLARTQAESAPRKSWQVVARTAALVAAGLLVPLSYLAPELADIQQSAYFNVDDFDNVYWTYHLSAPEMLGNILDPTFSFFRPVGLFPYWLLGRAFNLDPTIFHAAQTGLNVLNAGLVCLLVVTLTRSGLAAVLTSLLWITSDTLLESLWWFGSVQHTLATTWLVLALLVFAHIRRWMVKSIAVGVLYLLAIKSHEAAVILPAVLVAYEVIVQRKIIREAMPRVVLYVVLGTIAAAFTYVKVAAMSSSAGSGGYRLSFTLDTLIDNATWYAAQLFPWVPPDSNINPLLVLGGLAILGIVLRDRLMIFGLAFAAITMLPIIFLVDHRFAFYWYISAIGVWMSVGQLAARFERGVTGRLPNVQQLVQALLVVSLILIALAGIELQGRTFRARRVEWTRAYAATFRDYVDSIVAGPDPPPQASLEVRDAPQAFDSEGLTTLYRVLFDRTDISVRRVR
jgi:hypothetical protein